MKKEKRKRHTEHGREAAAVASRKKFSNASEAVKYPCGVFVAHRKLLLWRIKATTKMFLDSQFFSCLSLL